MIVQLVIVEPVSKRGSHPVRLPLLVGRGKEAKFRIQQERVSRRHCELSATDGVVYLVDLGSTNGTLLEGGAVLAGHPTRVPAGATVRVGSLSFRVDYDSFAETPTVELRSADLAGGLTQGPLTGGLPDIDIDIRFDGDDSAVESDSPIAAAPPATPEESDVGAEPDEELRRFLDGLG